MPHIQDQLVLTENADDELEALLARFEEVDRDCGNSAPIEERIWTIEALLEGARLVQASA